MNHLPANHRRFFSVVDFASATVLPTVTVETISAELEFSALQANSRKIVLDFKPMIYLTSEMIGGLMMFREYCVRNGIVLKLCNLSDNVQSVFALTALDTLLDCYDDCQEAVESFDDGFRSCVDDDFCAEHQEGIQGDESSVSDQEVGSFASPGLLPTQ